MASDNGATPVDRYGFGSASETEWAKAGLGRPQKCGGCGTVFIPTRSETFPYMVNETTPEPTVEMWLYVCPDCLAKHGPEDEWWDEL